MPVRTAYAGAAVAGEVLTAANVNKIPGGWIGFAEVTANQTGIGTTTTDLTGLSVAVTVGASRRIRITAGAQISHNNVSNGGVRIQEGSTTLQLSSYVSAAIGGVFWHGPSVVLTPTTGAHTYKLTLTFSTGTGDLLASVGQPAFILVEDLGPAT